MGKLDICRYFIFITLTTFITIVLSASTVPSETVHEPPCNGDLDQVFSPCGSSCERTCENINDPNWKCTPNCTGIGGCRCAPGLVRNYGWICVKPEDCNNECPEGEAYSRCGANECQDTCAEPNKKSKSTNCACVAGCVCVLGYVRDANGVCIPVETCGVSCGKDKNAIQTSCANECSRRTCTTINDEPFFCSAECSGIKECTCKPGYVKHQGKCIPISKCPTCPGANELYLNRPCDLNCANLTEKCDSTKSCTDGCYCDIGYARNYKGVCVRLDKCPQTSCDGDNNAIYDQCNVDCPKTCQYKNGDPNCIPSCKRQGGCVCRDGFVKSNNGKCIAPEECNILPRSALKSNHVLCPTHEVYSECANCQKTCSMIKPDSKCICKPGCACEGDLMRNSQGECVPNNKCDSPCNGDMDKVFDACGDSCARTCENINNPNWKCTPKCTEGGACVCKPGLVKNYGGHCVLPKDCDSFCPENEVYSNCSSNNCQNTCDNPNKKMSCNDICKSGCVCLEGHVRDSHGVCMPYDLCEVTCGGDPNAMLTTCANDCSKRNCSIVNDEPFTCSADCDGIPTCVCKPGYVIRDGKCIPITSCPTCPGRNEMFLCRVRDLTCSNMTFDDSEPCKEGCFCDLGYARNDKGVCVRLTKCPQTSCDGDPNAIFDQCDVDCQKTCSKPNGDPDCISVCKKKGGCICKEGFLKNAEGQCVRPEECNLKQRSKIRKATDNKVPICLPNEVKSSCANCDKTCSIRTPDPACICQEGYSCAKGYLRNSQGVCVPKNQCDSPCNNDMDQIYDPCGNSCERTCDNINDPHWNCTPQCTPDGACRCNDGLVRNSAGFCVLPKDCTQKCSDGEGYSQSGNNDCQNTCAYPKKSLNCTAVGKPGCICMKGYMRDCNGICIPQNLCNETCGGDANAMTTTCDDPCNFYTTCSALNDDFSDIACIQGINCNLPPRCVCKPGYVEQDKSCIPKSQCPTCNGANESYLSRPCDLNCYSLNEKCDAPTATNPLKDGCFCKIGFARDHKNACIRLDKCPQKSCDGDPNALYDQFGLNCQKTCSNKDGDPKCVPVFSRRGGCVCRDGFVKNDDGKCIPPQDCDISPKSLAIPRNLPRNAIIPPTPSNDNIQKLVKANSFASVNDSPFGATSSSNSMATVNCIDPVDKPTRPPFITTTCEPVTTTTRAPTTTTTCEPTTTTTSAPITTTTCEPTTTTTRAPITTTTCEPMTTTTTTTTTTTPKPTTKTTSKTKCTTTKPKMKKRSEIPECGENEILEQFPMTCTPSVQTCEMYFRGENPVCTMDMQNCKPECRCMAGFVRNKKGKCVTPQNCCEDPNSQFIAGPNQCPGGTCKQPWYDDCDAPWVPFGCQCKPGYLKISDTDSTCVPECECCKYN